VAFEHVLLAGYARLVGEGAAKGDLEAGGGLAGSDEGVSGGSGVVKGILRWFLRV